MTRTKLNRRQMCRLLAAGPAALAVASPCLGALDEKGFELKYVLASSMYGKLKLEDIVGEVRKSGAAQIDLWPMHHANQREQMDEMGHDEFARLLEAHDVRLGMTTRYDLGPFGLEDEMKVLKRFGGLLIVAGSEGPRDVSGSEAKAAVKEFVEKMKPHVAAAEEAGVTIGIENHARALIATPDSIRYLGEFSASPNGKGCMEKLPKEEELEQMPGRGELDFRPILAALKKIDYRHYTEIFMHPVPRGIPIMETLAGVTAEINRARAYLGECLGEA